MIRDIVTFPSKSLRRVSAPIDGINNEILTLIEDMSDTLYSVGGYGLAAIQVGVDLRLFIVDEDAGALGKKRKVFINPEIIKGEGEIVEDEGCLSLPDEYTAVARFATVTVKALDEFGNPFELDATDKLSRIIQHEHDHLNGLVFLDRIPKFKRDTIKKHIKRRIQDGDYKVLEV